MTPDRASGEVYDRLVAKGVSPFHAATIGQAARAELIETPRLAELFVTKVVDHAGEAHPVVVRKPTPGACVLYRLDMRGIRRLVQRELAAEMQTDERAGDGTKI